MQIKRIHIILFFCLLPLLFTAGKSKKNIVIRGSETMLSVTRAIAKCCYRNTEYTLNIDGGNSNYGIEALLKEECDVAMSSRKMTAVEKLRATNTGTKVVEIPVALDAVTFIVHPSNKVKELNRQQLEDIYSGKISNWQAITGDNMKIIIAINNTGGTFDLFNERIMFRRTLTANLLLMPDAIGITQSVGQMKNAIGFVPYAFADTTVKKIAVDIDNNKYVIATPETIKNKSYPLTRLLYYYFLEKNTTKVQAFTDAVKSEEGLKQFTNAGFIELKK